MKTAKEMYQYCLDNGYGKGFTKGWGVKHFKLIEKSLHDDEEVFIAFMGLHNFTSVTKHDSNYAYAITNKRIIMAQKKMIGENFKTVSLDYINDIEFNSGMVWGTLKIDTLKEVFNIGLDKKDAKNISEKVQSFIHDLKKSDKESEKATDSSKSPIEELKDLKELLDSGALTQEEFDNQKKKILNK